MKISVIGTGYVGITIACLADYGHEVVLIGRNKEKINKINEGISHIYEPGLEEILKRNIKSKMLFATTDYKEIDDSDVVFIAVGTPSNKDGSIDLSQIKSASEQIAKHLDGYKVVAVKSTVVPSTTKNTILPILEKVSGKKCGDDFGLSMNPEFLREGSGVYDFLNPDKIVIGAFDEKSYKAMEKVYDGFNKKIPRIKTDLTTAEMIKYVQNSALAARISFINEMANLCEKFSVDVYEVADVIGLDSRIGRKFLDAGCGFGGSCFPKDVKALLATARSAGIEPKILKSILDVNEKQPYRMVELAKEAIENLKNKNVAVLGLAFKPDTDDMREAASITIIKTLIKEGAKVKAYDPKAMENAKSIFHNSITYAKSAGDCLKDADICLIVTEWDEFKKLDINSIKCPIVDGRRVFNPNKVLDKGLIYKGIGWKNL